MYLKKYTIINYKSCRLVEVDLEKNLPNTFIGTNDCGKSSILEALRLLLEKNTNYKYSEISKISSDLSNTPLSIKEFESKIKDMQLPNLDYSGRETYIIGEFYTEEDDNFEGCSELLTWTIKQKKNITIAKRFYISEQNQKSSTTFILSSDSNPGQVLWEKTDKILNDTIKELGNITVKNENNSGPHKKIEKILAIYDQYTISDQRVEYRDYLKELDYFPKYKYLDWNCSLTELEDLASNAMKGVIDKHTEDLKNYASTILGTANTEINNAFDDLVRTLIKDLPQVQKIKSKLYFNIDPKITDIVLNKHHGDGDIALASQGDGVKRQIRFALLKYRSQIDTTKANKQHIWCFDEPETHLYPKAQRDFYDVLKNLSSNSFQILVSTHSTTFIDRADLKNINNVEIIDGYSRINKCKDADDIYKTLDLRNSDFLFFNKFLVVEGDTESHLMDHFYSICYNKNILEHNVKLIVLDGSGNMPHYKGIINKLFEDFQRTNDKVIYLLDADTNIIDSNTILIGHYDFEDALNNNIWIKIIKDSMNIDISNEELDGIRADISNDSDHKFHKILKKHIYDQLEDGNKELIKGFPSKGKNLAEYIKKCITNIDQIPEKVRSAFTLLQ